MKLTTEQHNQLKTLWFARCLAMCYSGEELNTKLSIY